MNEPSVIRTEQTIVRTGRWVMAFGGASILRLVFQLSDLTHSIPIYTLFFLLDLAFGLFSILAGEWLTRRSRGAFVTLAALGGLLVSISAVWAVALAEFLVRVARWVSTESAIELYGPRILMCVITVGFWGVVLRVVLNTSAIMRSHGTQLPSRGVLLRWLAGAVLAGITLSAALVRQYY